MIAAMDSLEPVAASPKPPRRKRAANAAAPSEKAPVCHILPSWLPRAAQGGDAPPAFAAGAVVFALDHIVGADPAWLEAWRARQTLRAAAASARSLRHREDEAALRDAHHLTRPGDDPGPAGKLYRLWRAFSARPARLAGPCLEALADALGARAPAGAFDGLTLASDHPDPLAAALAAADACVRGFGVGGGEAAVLAAMAADLVLAHRLGWPRPLPLFFAGAAGRRTPAAEGYARIVREALVCHGQAMDLEGRAARLIAAAAAVRVKGADRGVAALLADDVVAAADLARPDAAALGSDRAARRFLDRLVALGALREMTRRPTFRLYGL